MAEGKLIGVSGIIIYWTLVVLAAFAFALAVQMRVMIGVVLRKALVARNPSLDAGKANAAIGWAANGTELPAESDTWLREEVAHLNAEYPRPISHLRIARRWCVIGPVLVLLLLALGRFRLGMF